MTDSAALPTGPLRLLVVDDDAVDRLSVRRLLGHGGLRDATIVEAENAERTRALLGSDPGAVHCVVLDYHLAGETGLEVLAYIRAHHPRVPVIVLTGSSDPETAASLVKAGALDFLIKDGLSAERLEQAIRGAIRVSRAEGEAQESRERLSATLRSIGDAVITVGNDLRIVYLNVAAENLTGWREAEAIGRSLDEVASVTRPDDAAPFSLTDHITKVINGPGDEERTELAMTTRDGRHLVVDLCAAPLDGSSDVVNGAVVALRDITDRRQAEADVESLSRVGNSLAAELDLERIVQIVTDAATALTGAQFGAFFYNVTDAQGEKLTLYTLSGAPREAFQDFGHPRPTPVFAPTFYGTMIVRSDDITKDARYGQVAPFHGMPPGHLPVRSYLAVPVYTRSGEVLGGLFFGHATSGVFTERSERLAVGTAAWAGIAMENARLYDSEKRARAAAETANHAKSEFLANMSHELRTPLNAIGGYADLIIQGIRGPVTDEQSADLTRIKRSQHHLLSLINDILNFAKIEAGRVQIEPRMTSMNAVLGQLEVLVGPQLAEKGLKYEYRCCDASFTAYVDPERLQQILLNLLSNAVKFTLPGGEIRIECSAQEDAMAVRVSDTGVGIPPDKL
ncbi:MAG: ATP-binding region ATPase domain protein, partial [Gemmatimonadetes bacterium]|nr:ATP-binding region ATPase domain protein [Gemmatimonadota bacterium]